jgi:hypothetical protein
MDNFIQKLNYLGGNLGLSPSIKEYVDLEVFFIECTLFFDTDDRVKQTILNWLFRYGSLLSPSKIRRLLKSTDYNHKNLTAICHLLISNYIVKQNWQILITKRPTNLKFKSNEKKYLKKTKFVFKNVPELFFRAGGRSQVASDLFAFLKKEKFTTLYHLAKKIHSPRNRVNQYYNQFFRLGLI